MTEKHGWLGLWVAALMLLTACAGRTAAEPSGAAPIMAQAQQSPAEVVSAFLDAWNAKNFDEMYSFVSPQSQEHYPFQVFRARYDVAQSAVNFAEISHTIKNTTLQGLTAAVTYDAVIESPFFGTIDDPGRIMRLVQSPQGWRIAWSSMDIFANLVAQGRIQVDSDFPPRASIYDRNGQPLVEENGTVKILYVVKQDMPSEDNCLDLLRSILRRPRPELAVLFSNYNPDTLFYVDEIDEATYNARRIDLEATCAIYDDANKVGTRQTRRYAGNGVAAHVTGYIARVPADQLDVWENQGYQSSDVVGLAGIESAYEETLAGRAERYLRIVEPGGQILRELAGSQGSPPTPITLTIDSNLQMITAQALSDAFNYATPNWGSVATGAAVVIIDVNTGAIRALASYPSFNPSIFNPDTLQPDPNFIANLNTDTRRPLVNKATQEQYSPGSAFKIVTTAAAAQEGIFGLDELFTCELTWDGRQFGDTLESRSDWRLTDGFQATGDITIAEALTSSCDPFYYQMGALLYRKNANLLVNYSERMGLGSALRIPGLDQAEAPGSLAPPGSPTEAINNAIGQGNVALPPLQMAQMVAAVANGGTLYKTYLVERIGGVDGAELDFQAEPEVVRDIGLDPEVIRVIQDGMCAVTTDENLGTAEYIFKEIPYTLCGKTGTAQTALYPNAWFVAYTPAANPELAIAVVVPNTLEGSQVAAPIVRRILDIYYDAPVEDFLEWWNTEEFTPLDIPTGGTGGG
jgi:penicillin-binding protein 2